MLKALEEKIKYTFNDKTLLEKALTHSSYEISLDEKKREMENNQRLEFLGDAVLETIISKEVFNRYKDKDEGALTKIRAGAVCEDALFSIGKNIDIGDFLKLGVGEKKVGGNNKKAIIADAVEALIGAIFLDSGYNKTEEVVRPLFDNTISHSAEIGGTKNYKSELQEKLQKKKNIIGCFGIDNDKNDTLYITAEDIKYFVVREEGPPHEKVFYVEVLVKEIKLGEGKGKSKREAEQVAAKVALEEVNKCTLKE